MALKPATLKGTRDFLPAQVIRRNYIFDVIRDTFQRYGYRPIETPAMEKRETLTGNYGEEGDRLIFKILNNGDYLSKVDPELLDARDSRRVLPSIAKRALRYDLTVPFARFVVQHRNDIQFPFKRYQIQPVWRADRPQKGRYQEFYQCDVDVVGSSSLMYEAELLAIYRTVFEQLKLPVQIRVNNRKILMAIAEAANIPDRLTDMTVAIDKLDKIGVDKVKEEMRSKCISSASVDLVMELIFVRDLDHLEALFSKGQVSKTGIEELRNTLAYFGPELPDNIILDFTLARGLHYYTGFIVEVSVEGVTIGSVGGGGRYDNLTDVFGLAGVSGVGVSFGAERIYDAMEELNVFPDDLELDVRVIVLSMDPVSHRHGFGVGMTLRAAGIACDVYPEAAKFKKQIKYADQRGIPYALIIGEEERTTDAYTLKDLKTGAQNRYEITDIIDILKGRRPLL